MTTTSAVRRIVTAAALAVTFASPVVAQTTVEGIIYASYRYGLVKDEALTPDARQNNFELDRAYLTMRSRSGTIATRVTVDVDGRRAATNQQTIRLKYAYADWTPEGSSITWRLGMQNTPAVGYLEDVWGYRMQGAVTLDRYRYTSSSDIGFAAEGAWKSNAITAYSGIYNGEGYSSAPGDNRKDFATRVSVRLLKTDNETRLGGLRLTGYASIGRSNGGGVRNRFLGLLSYQTKTLTLGAEASSNLDSTAVSAKQHGRILSGFATHKRAESKLGLMGRVDFFDPNTALSPAAFDPLASSQTRVVAGVMYQLAPNARILLDLDMVSTERTAPNAFQAANRAFFLHTEFRF
jgi:hypothetical protein